MPQRMPEESIGDGLGLATQAELEATKTSLITTDSTAAAALAKANNPLAQIAPSSVPSSVLKNATDADKLHMQHLGADVVAAMTGASPVGTIPAVGSVVQESLANAAVTRTKLDADVQASIPTQFDPAAYLNQFVWAITDMANQVALGIKPDGSVFAKLAAGVVTTAQIANGSNVNGAALTDALNTLQNMAPAEFDSDVSGYTYAILDAQNRIGFAIKKDGTLVGKFQLPDGSITSNQLSIDLQGALPSTIGVESGYVYAIVDAQNRIGFGIKANGKAFINLDASSLGAGSITYEKLDPTIVNTIVNGINNPYDTMEVEPDGWRQNHGDVWVQTETSGSGWAVLPRILTPIVKGVNTAGTSLQFRKRTGLSIRGRYYQGTFDPKANGLESIVFKGGLGPASTWPPTGTFNAGDYYRYRDFVSATIGGFSLVYGDMLVWTGIAWAKQNGPLTPSQAGDWFIIGGTGGYYDGIQYPAGARMVYVGIQSNGSAKDKQFLIGDPTRGDYFYRGEFTPTSGLPASPIEGDLWSASAAGTASSITFAAGDMLVYESGAFGLVQSEPIRTIASGSFVNLPCARNANEWEVRRTDKSGTIATVKLKGYMQRIRKEESADLVMWSDSMGGTLTNKMTLFSPRVYTLNVYGGGTSTNILNMMHREINSLGDRYKGRFHIFWHGQNNTNNEAISIAPRLLELAGAYNLTRFVFMSVLGVRSATFNGTRLVIADQENPFNNVAGSRSDIVNYYKTNYPDNLFDSRALTCRQASASVPALDFPGMTEKQVADTYGIVPLSFFLDFTAVPWVASNLVFKGYYSTAGLPTGGVNNDYYVRTGGGTVGEIIVNVSGTWIEYTYDRVHINANVGGLAVVTELKNFIDTRGW